jgi:hypothetical protein
MHVFWSTFFDDLFWLTLGMQLLPTLVPGVYWLARRSIVRWTWWDAGLLIVPHWTWFLLLLTTGVEKGWGNVGLEPLSLGVFVAVVILARMLIAPRGLSTAKGVGMELAALGFAFGLHFLVPALHSN